MNKELLLEIKERILKEPERFIMDDFFSNSTFDPYDQCEFSLTKECGTSACIAGGALFLNNRSDYLSVINLHGYEDPAAEILGLTDQQAASLFFESDWP